jgi:radical SAM family uncharacterized protein/radical SAM-linked protein
VLNRDGRVVAERTYAPWGDMEALMRQRRVPLFTLESFRPVREFDVVGFTLQSELNYTNILNMLDLAGIPVERTARQGADPLVLAGGPNAYNPAPLSDFIDAFVIGDGEEAVAEISRVLLAAKQQGVSRAAKLEALSQVEGVYVPGVTPPDRKVRARVLSNLADGRADARSLVPLSRIAHDRLAVEIMRGCRHGCRFCAAGLLYRPVRERPRTAVLATIDRELAALGWEEVSLLSLSTTDYTDFAGLMRDLGARRIDVAVPSQRLDSFLLQLDAVKGIKKGGLTFAPEAGTDRLRRVLNKTINSEELMTVAAQAFQRGWSLLKLYFMVGLPDERPEDIDGIVDLVARLSALVRRGTLKVTVSPFIPKPFTPFQWEAQEPDASVFAKISYLKKKIAFRNVEFTYRDTALAMVEGIISRGDARIGRVIRRAWELGATFDGWSDRFSFPLWQQALAAERVSAEACLAARDTDQPLPWDMVDARITRDFLLAERAKAYRAETTAECGSGACAVCGRCPGDVPATPAALRPTAVPAPPAPAGETGRKKTRVADQAPAILRKRLKFTKGDEVKFISHLDVMQVFHRCFRMADVPVLQTQGFHPHPRIAFGPPLGVGLTSRGEYMDVALPAGARDITAALNAVLPRGLVILAEKNVLRPAGSLSAEINRMEYEAVFLEPAAHAACVRALAGWHAQREMMVTKIRDGAERRTDLRPYLADVQADAPGRSIRFTLLCDQAQRTVKPYDVLAWCFPDAETPLCRIERTAMFICKNGTCLTPMEVV